MRRALGGAIGVVLLAGCRSPTQIDVTVSTDVPCPRVSGSSLTTGTLGEIERIPPASTTTSCVNGYIGSVVLVPNGDDGALVGFKVVTGLDGQPVDQCVPDAAGSYGPRCIVSRRALRYLPHTPLTVQVRMSGACAGVACDPVSTCVQGACVRATIGDPSACEGSGCNEGVLAPDGGGGGPGDAAPADGASVDATLSDASVSDAAVEGSTGPADGAGLDAAPPDAAVLGCDLGGVQAGSPWPMSGFCPTRRAKSPLPGPAAVPHLLWRYPATGSLPGIANSGPALGADGTIYVALQSGYVEAVSPGGARLWERSTGVPDGGTGFLAQPVLAADQTLRLFSFDNGGYTVFPLDGGAFKQTPIFVSGAPFNNSVGPALVSGGVMYLGDGSGDLAAIDSSGNVLWTSVAHSDELDRVAVGRGGEVFSQNSGPTVAAVYGNRPDGGGEAWKWTFSAADHVRGTAVAPDGTLRAYDVVTNVIVALDPAASAADAQAGLVWQASLAGGAGIAGLAVDDEGTTYAGGSGCGLRAVDRSGALLPGPPLGACGAPVLDANENVYAWCDAHIVSYARGLAASNWGGGYDLTPLLDPNMASYVVPDTVVLGAGGAVYFTVDEALGSGAHVDLLLAIAP